MDKKENKWLYGWNIWTDYGYGWENECTYLKPEENYSTVRRDAAGYREGGARVRITKTRVPNPNYGK